MSKELVARDIFHRGPVRAWYRYDRAPRWELSGYYAQAGSTTDLVRRHAAEADPSNNCHRWLFDADIEKVDLDPIWSRGDFPKELRLDSLVNQFNRVIKLRASDIRVGDLIVEFSNGQSWETSDWLIDKIAGNHGLCRGSSIYSTLQSTTFRVVRPGEIPKPAAGAWNGRCPGCGRGTYTGLIQVEHEGGPCR